MSQPDSHPDDLLDLARHGDLDDEQARRLDDHVRECPTCRLELELAKDFDVLLGPDEDADARALESANRAIAKLDIDVTVYRTRRSWWIRAAWLSAAVLAAGAAAAGIWQSMGSGGGESRAPVVVAAASVAEAPPPTPPRNVETTVSVEDLEVVADTVPSGSSVSMKEPGAPTAAELFSSATRAHREGRNPEAVRLFQELQRRYPSSREARASHATLGRLLLDGADPNAALKQFDEYLANPGGAVGEEALVGRARALESLGRRDEERAVWRDLLQRYPNSVHAGRAKRRLSELR